MNLSVSRLVVVVGSINRDVLARVQRFPIAGETVLSDGIGGPRLGGKGANQAVAAARLGARVEFVGAVAQGDLQGVRAELDEYDVATTWLAGTTTPTGWAHVLIDPTGENMIVVDPGANRVLNPQTVEAAIRAMRPALVLTQCEVDASVTAQAMSTGREIGAITMCNASPAVDLDALGPANLDLVIVNKSEAEHLTGECRSEFAGVVLARLTGGTAVVTLGSAGSIVASVDGATHVPAASVSAVIDTTGAGDVFAGALASRLVDGGSIDQAMQLAGEAAAWTVGRVGTVGPRRADL
jgi:ribokinase